MLTTSFGHGDILMWFVEIFFFVVWFWLLMSIVSDLFRDHEASGVTKALWVVLVLIFPVFGILAYLILRGGGGGACGAFSAGGARAFRFVRQVGRGRSAGPRRSDPEGEGPARRRRHRPLRVRAPEGEGAAVSGEVGSPQRPQRTPPLWSLW